jgi:hypothetical protein
MDPVNILLIMGAGTYSDGVYKFNIIDKTFELMDYAFKPKFITYCTQTNSFYAGYDAGLMHSTDGLQWSRLELFEGKICASMLTCGLHYIVTAVNSDSTLCSIFYSSDGGVNWTENPHPSPPVITSMAVNDNDVIYGIYPGNSWSSGLWYSKDFGETWEVEYYSPQMSCISYYGEIFIAWASPLGADRGVAIYDPVSHQPYFMTENLPNLYINKLSHNNLINCLNVVCCTKDGAFITCDFPTGINGNPTDGPDRYSLENNYPNPFNPSTKITFSVPNIMMPQNAGRAVYVKLVVYDAMGSEIETLLNESKHPGFYEVEFNASDLASGVYYYRMIAGDFVETKKMLLLK